MTKKITLVISVVDTSTLERQVEDMPFSVTITEPDGTTIRWDWRAN